MVNIFFVTALSFMLKAIISLVSHWCFMWNGENFDHWTNVDCPIFNIKISASWQKTNQCLHGIPHTSVKKRSEFQGLHQQPTSHDASISRNIQIFLGNSNTQFLWHLSIHIHLKSLCSKFQLAMILRQLVRYAGNMNDTSPLNTVL